jgi:protein-disulfide isomerase-like protein with CxxC motif
MQLTHFSDPGCPWAWSAGPALATLRWRYGDQLQWQFVMIGLSETAEQYRRRGYTAERQARGYRSFRRRGMPFATAPRERPHATWPMCRAVVATRRLFPDREWAAFRALQFAQFTSTLTLDEPAGIQQALEWVPGIDAAKIVAASLEPETEELFAADRSLARSAAGGATEFQGRSATTPDGEVRFTAPSVIFTADDGSSLEVGGFQPVEAYDVAIANLDRSLTRREPSEDVAEVLAAFPDGLTTYEVAAVMAKHLQPPDRDEAEDALISLAAGGGAERRPFGNDALWTPAKREAAALAA